MSKKDKSTSKSSASNERINTAIHILQGGFGRVLGRAVLLGANATNATSGKLMLEMDAAPTDAQIAESLSAANDAVRRDLAVSQSELERSAADARAATDAAVNGTTLYGARAPPPNFTRISIVHIADWCVANSAGPHLASTKAVGQIRILKHDFTADRKRLSIFVEIDPPAGASEASAKSSTANTVLPAATSVNRSRYDDSMHVPKAALRILDSLLPAIDGDAARAAAREHALKSLELELFQFKNAAYTAGFISGKKAQ